MDSPSAGLRRLWYESWLPAAVLEWAALYEDGGRCRGLLVPPRQLMPGRQRGSGSRWSARSRGAARTNDLEARQADGRISCRSGGTPKTRGQRSGGDRLGGWGAGLISLSPPGGRIRSGRRGFAPVAHLRDGPSMRPERWLWRLPERRACWW